MALAETYDLGHPPRSVQKRDAPPFAAINQNGGPLPTTSVSMKTWLTVIGANLGAFLAVLNIQIVNSSLADIQGAIGTGADNGGWISTSYLITEIIVIPLSAWLARAFSIRRYLLANTFLFLVFSAACASAHSLTEMIVWRAFQGFTGGVMIPMAFTIIMTMLPKAKQPVGLAMFAISATFAPAIGPTIGGWLNDNLGWQYIFYVNLAPGAVMLAILWPSLEAAPMQLGLLRQGDWAGIATMALGLGALQTVLEEGNKDDWFGSPLIVRLSIIAAVSLTLFIWIEFTKEQPLLNLRLWFRRNFAFGGLANFLLGSVMYGSVFVLPVYLSSMQGYNAQQIGEVLAWSGLPQLLIIPFVPLLMKKIDPRVLIGLGLALFAASMFMNIGLSVDYSGAQFMSSNIVRALGQAVILTPLASVTTAGVERENAHSASSLFNMMRNLGGAIGIASLQTLITKREQFHSSIINEKVSLFKQATQARIDQLTTYFLTHGVADPSYARHEAITAIGRSVREQAYFLAYSDSFLVMGAALLLAVAATALLKKPNQFEADVGH